MPWAPARPCSSQGCPNSAEYRGKCRTCSTRAEQRRGTRQARGYDERWLRYSARWRRLHPICGERADGQLSSQHSACVREGRIGPAQVTDHITPHRGDDGLMWAPENHQSLCTSCHAVKSQSERG